MGFACSSCGTPLQKQQLSCARCGLMIDWGTGAPPPEESHNQKQVQVAFCPSCQMPLAQSQPACSRCGQPIDWIVHAPALDIWKTSVGFSILGVISPFIIMLALMYGATQLVHPFSAVLNVLFVVFGIAYSVAAFVYPLAIYPSFFKAKPLIKSSKAISFLNWFVGAIGLAFGLIGILFPIFWSRNLGKREKGSSNIVFVILLVFSFAISGVGVSSGLANQMSINQSATYFPLALPELELDWQRVDIPDVGTIDMPPTMEEPSQEYRNYEEATSALLGTPSATVIAQQYGLNELTEEGLNNYARIIIELYNGEVGEYESLTYDVTEYSQVDIDELDTIFRKEVESGFQGTQLQLRDWYPLKLETINGMSCIHIQYSRELNDNPPVMINMYLFEDIDRMYLLTLSYRIQDEQRWKNDLEHSLSTFRIAQ